jgi:hypothetical protein
MSRAELNRTRYLNMAVPVGTLSGMPVALGWITGHALNDRDAAGNADVSLPLEVEVLDIPITARFAIDPAHIGVGDRLYYNVGLNVVDNDPAGIPWGACFEELLIVGGADTIGTRNVIKWTF